MGHNNSGQLGDGSSTDRSVPVQVATGVARIAAGSDHSLFIKTDGSLWAMGSNSSGQLGDGTTVNRDRPIHVADGVVSATAGSHSLFFKSDGTLRATGSNSSGQLGDGTTSTRSTPVQVATSVAGISASGDFSLVLDLRPTIRTEPADIGIAGGNPVVFTSEADGPGPFSWQWYAGPAGDTSAPVTGATSATFSTPPVTAAATYWARVANDHGTADTRAATVAPVTFPVIVSQPVAQTITLGGTGALSVSTTGGMASYQWYEGSAGDISNPVPGANSDVLVTPPLISASSYWVRVSNASGSADSAAAVISVAPPVPANLRAAGSAAYGKLGTGTMTAWIHPAPVGDDIAEVAVSPGHVLFLKTDGTLWAAGANQHGQLGDGTTIGRSRPVMIASEVSSIAVSSHRSPFVKTDGTLWLMGASYGPNPTQILTGVTRAWLSASHLYHLDATLTLRQRIAGGGSSSIFATGVASFSSGSSHSLFVKTDKTLWGFGNNSNGQLGDNRLPVSSPVKLADDVATAAAGDKHSLFLKTDGSLWSMGGSANGRLGDDTTTNRPTPVQVDAGVFAASACGSHSLWLTSNCAIPVTTIAGHPPSAWIEPGSTASLIVDARGEALSYQWYRGLPGDVENPFPDATAATFTTTAEGSFWVRATGANGSANSRAAQVTFIVPPEITTQPALVAREPGGGFTLAAIASNAWSYQWFAGLAGDESQPLAGATGATLLTRPVTATNPFWVRATNPAGSADLSITVEPPAAAGRFLFAAGQRFGSSNPVLLSGAVTTAASGGNHGLFVTTDGTLWAVGQNTFGQLGTGNTVTAATPVRVADDVTAVAAGNDHSLFIRKDGSLWAMGRNINGQLGIASNSAQSLPVPVTDGVVAIAAGSSHSLFIRSDGSLSGMGRNLDSELLIGGNASPFSRSEFFSFNVPVLMASNIATAAAGSSHSLFVRRGGTMWATGRNTNRQLTVPANPITSMPVEAHPNVHVVSAAGNNTFYLATAAAGDPPAILHHPQSVFLDPGESASLIVSAAGSGPLIYQWFKGRPGDTSSPLAGSTSPSLSVTSSSPAGEVWVRASNAAAYADSRAATVITAPTTEGYRAWAAAQGLAGPVLDPAADPDHDGRPNVLEFALGTHPLAPDAAPLRVTRMPAPGGAEITLRLRADSGLIATLQYGETLGNWQNAALEFAEGSWRCDDPLVEIIATQPDGDGLDNLTEFSLATDPLAPTGAEQRPFGSLNSEAGPSVFTLTHRRRKHDPPATIYQWSADLVTWHDFEPAIIVTDSDIGNDGRAELVTATRPRNEHETRIFLRIRHSIP